MLLQIILHPFFASLFPPPFSLTFHFFCPSVIGVSGTTLPPPVRLGTSKAVNKVRYGRHFLYILSAHPHWKLNRGAT